MGYVDDKEISSSRKYDAIGQALVIGGLTVMVIYTWILIFSNNPSSLKFFAVHPPFQVLAIAIFGVGIITLQPTTMSQPKAKARGFKRHQLFMLGAGLPIIAVGSLAIIYNKFARQSAHFTSWHGTLGIISLIWMLLQIAIGGASVWFGGKALGKNPKAFYKYHRVSGYLLLTLFLLVIHVGGAWSSFSMNNAPVAMRVLAYAIAPIAVLIGVWSRARLDKMKLF